jgi:cytochrome c553
MRGHPAPTLVVAVALAGLCATASAATPQEERLRTRALAATCAQCHGPDGRAVEGEAMIRLAGRPQDDLLTQLLAFRAGQRPATIMHQITKGYSPEQLEAVSKYFSEVK